MKEEVKYPATHIVHWVTGPVACCEDHANQLIGLGQYLGGHVIATVNSDASVECMNCVNEN